MKPILIAVVGIDGAGKTSQAHELAGWLRGGDWHVRYVPNQTLLPVRRALDRIAVEDGLGDHTELLDADTMRLLASGARLAALHDALVEPAPVTVVDRYTYCQYAAARLLKAGNEDVLRRLNRELPTPDLTLYLDIEPVEAQRRIKARGVDEETLEFLGGFRDAYRSLPEYESFTIIDAGGDFGTVQGFLREPVRELLAGL
ncbi:dTMP kinase [Phytomonospora endophytica]|uniref:Thymidylate kinase n=1 Tax=Phytomonospora endophytica TaxID=714109 RepID=A0A841FZM1_9ACTN|nr:thymidylate kinase [Phytomonospora endophytica]MBB6038972.1 dTMP kinase [Phytomonospora endophytica]GIG67924.1 thymidylate kinase [Phytomonospora endophytica]